MFYFKNKKKKPKGYVFKLIDGKKGDITPYDKSKFMALQKPEAKASLSKTAGAGQLSSMAINQDLSKTLSPE